MTMKFIFRFKGGPGSGHHGHSGLKGVWGGSTPSGKGSSGSSSKKKTEPETNIKADDFEDRLSKAGFEESGYGTWDREFSDGAIASLWSDYDDEKGYDVYTTALVTPETGQDEETTDFPEEAYRRLMRFAKKHEGK